MPKQSSKKLQIVGHFDYVDEGYAYGWAVDPRNSLDRVTVEILCNGNVVGRGKANEYRQDLKEAGLGDGYHLFRIKLSYEIYDGEAHTLQARNTSNNVFLTGSDLVLPPHPPRVTYPVIPRTDGERLISELYQASARKTPQSEKAKIIQAYRIASLLQETEEYDDARYAWEALAKVLGENAYCTCKLAESYLLEGNVSIALDLYQRAAGLNLNFSWSHLGMSLCQRLLGDEASAEEALALAMALPRAGKIAGHLHKAYLELLPYKVDRLKAGQDQAKAIDLLFQVIMSHPNSVYANSQLDSLIAEEIRHTGSKSTESALVAHRRSVKRLESAILAAHTNTSQTHKARNEADKYDA
ncbi:tetratricopeptide repeat protein [Pseudomonas promysalinigenes]|uniref:tetratricopeptide repeat protein n=1 Tax=Pseudomonas promysalinigenes TaxID=485898 RepID=UPI003FA06899